jgi:surfeit locus 1 family protein
VVNVVGNRRFEPAYFPGGVLALLGMALCGRLGMWQLDRAEDKRTLIAAFDSGSTQVMAIGDGKLQALPRYQSIEVSGRYDPERQVLLDNMPSARGQPGYRVLTPLQRDGGEWVLVDRGWVAGGRTRQQLPDVTVGAGPRIIRGRLDDLPRPGIRLQAAASAGDPAAGKWPRVLNFPEHAELTTVLGRSLAQRILLLDPSQPDGYERTWRARFRVGPERHLAYAVQWFALLAAILVTFLVVSFKKVVPADAG